MIRLIRAEVVRLLSRRFTIVSIIVVLAALGAFQLVVNDAFDEPRVNQVQTQDQPPECAGPDADPEMCADQDVVYEPPGFSDMAPISLQLAIYLAAFAAYMIAGSFVGAEFASGSMSNWLSFIPRRTPVFVSKLLTLSLFSAIFSAVCGTLALGAAVVLARIHTVPLEEMSKVMSMAGRGLIPAVALAAVGFCVGLVARHTAAAIGVLLGYLFVWFVRSALLSDRPWAQLLTPWTPEANLSAVVNNGTRYEVVTNIQTYESVTRQVSLTHGIVYWAVLVAALAVISGVIFRRRDVN